MNEDKYLTGPEIRDLLRITKQTLVALKKRPDFPKSYRPAGRDLWKRSEVEAYIESKKQDK